MLLETAEGWDMNFRRYRLCSIQRDAVWEVRDVVSLPGSAVTHTHPHKPIRMLIIIKCLTPKTLLHRGMLKCQSAHFITHSQTPLRPRVFAKGAEQSDSSSSQSDFRWSAQQTNYSSLQKEGWTRKKSSCGSWAVPLTFNQAIANKYRAKPINFPFVGFCGSLYRALVHMLQSISISDLR